MGIPEPMETYSSSPHLYTDLEIPEGSKGRLKTAGPPRVREPQAQSGSGSREGGRDGGRGGQRSGGDRGSRPPRDAAAGAPAAAPAADGASRPPRSRNRTRTRRPSTPAAE